MVHNGKQGVMSIKSFFVIVYIVLGSKVWLTVSLILPSFQITTTD